MLKGGTRNERRTALAVELRARATGNWGAWRTTELPDGLPGTGWTREIRAVHANDLYAVLVRPLCTAEGFVSHLAIRTASGAEPPWRDKQRIKNDLFGKHRVAIEVMPEAALLVDEADMYHMWVLPLGTKFDFGLGKEGAARARHAASAREGCEHER